MVRSLCNSGGRTTGRGCALVLFFMLLGPGGVQLGAQTSSTSVSANALPDAPQDHTERQDPVVSSVDTGPRVTEVGLPLAIAKDQAAIWTSPARVRGRDLFWLLPLGAATGVGLVTDSHVMRAYVSHDRVFNKDNVNASNYLLGGEIAVPVALYGAGLLVGNQHARETGLLSGEALADGLVVEEVTKVILRRERPLYNNANGDFFNHNAHLNGSFPSSHTVLAWSTAAVIAGEYPSLWARIGIYSAATGVSLTRVMGQEHFPTDVVVGSAAGWLVGHYVFKKHHRARVDFQ